MAKCKGLVQVAMIRICVIAKNASGLDQRLDRLLQVVGSDIQVLSLTLRVVNKVYCIDQNQDKLRRCDVTAGFSRHNGQSQNR